MPYSNFRKYTNQWFVETGSYYGDGIECALSAGFTSIFSIEITETFYNYCKERFKNESKVRLFFGDSVMKLWEVIQPIWGPATFYLDGHWDIDPNETRGLLDFPLLRELDIIATHPIKTHTIIIDDVRLINTLWNLGLDKVIEMIYKINPKYKIHYEDGDAGRKNDVLVATV